MTSQVITHTGTFSSSSLDFFDFLMFEFARGDDENSVKSIIVATLQTEQKNRDRGKASSDEAKSSYRSQISKTSTIR